MNLTHLPENQRIDIFNIVHDRTALSQVVLEKDWWVTVVLRALFSLPYAVNLSFKGGTSLSKCWNLIERFSEDVDIAINREYLGFIGTLSKTQIRDRLRRTSCSFVREKLQFDLQNQLETDGVNISEFSVNVNIIPDSTIDPEIVEVHYKTLFVDRYIKPIVKLEISGRSMSEPVSKVVLQSFLDETFPNSPISEEPFELNVVVPERTFLEKICLLHEEFAKPQKEIRTERMSRHLYDLERMMDTSIAEKALKDKELYSSIVEHRRTFIRLKDFDYDTLAPKMIKIIPPESVITQWQQDYETMQGTMIYGESLPFEKLMKKIQQLNEKINKIESLT